LGEERGGAGEEGREEKRRGEERRGEKRREREEERSEKRRPFPSPKLFTPSPLHTVSASASAVPYIRWPKHSSLAPPALNLERKPRLTAHLHLVPIASLDRRALYNHNRHPHCYVPGSLCHCPFTRVPRCPHLLSTIGLAAAAFIPSQRLAALPPATQSKSSPPLPSPHLNSPPPPPLAHALHPSYALH